MKGLRRFAAAALLTVVTVPLASCGGSSISYPSIKFVGNDSCPTAGASPYSPSPPEVNGDKIVGQAIDEMPHIHVNPPAKVQYNHNPPTSGCHYSLTGADPAPIQPGVYNQPVQTEYWVHNLEHGYVAVLYNCPTGCSDAVQALINWHKTLPPDPGAAAQQSGVVTYAKLIVLPYASMPVKFAAVSWDYYEGWNTFDLNGIEAFYNNHIGHAPEGAMSQ
ncbi:MAG TPA: DUF3105 domain-containing protein [Candidatus Dormibacteraeota bacterium]|nr:DUF3105 domain-containing protein [Candidatus Dormibacteraeota bacterium]